MYFQFFRKAGLLLILAAGSFLAYGQGSAINIGIYMNSGQDSSEISKIAASKLETRIINIINVNGVTSKVSASRINKDDLSDLIETMARGVVCVPIFEIYDKNIADTHLERIHVVDASLTLKVQYIHEDIIFNTLQMQLQGSGRSYDQAINNIIRNLRGRSNNVSKFLNETRERVTNYYDENCSSIIEQARQLDKLDRPLKAIQLLWPIPREVDCYEEVKDMSIDLYMKYINKQCQIDLLKSKTLFASNHFREGLEVLQKIDPSSICYEETLQLIAKIEADVDSQSAENRGLVELYLKETAKEDAELKRDERSIYMQQAVGRANQSVFQQNFIEKVNDK
ncbi:MAG: hypothetical protein AB8F78_18130 [Saprospiraceae bacterium]